MNGRSFPPDRLNEIGVLTRREIEARILAPFIEALSQQFDREQILEILRATIIQIAREQGQQLLAQSGGDSLMHFAQMLENWKKGDAMEMTVLEQSAERFYFDVTRCRYAEMYQSLGIPELGAILSCNRDFALIQGFNPEIHLERTQTIMQGAPCCDFRYSK